jgi:hypothetical protein
MVYHDGECPICTQHQSKIVLMKLNSWDFWECTECHLQISGAQPAYSIVLKETGNGVFHSSGVTANQFIIGRILIPEGQPSRFQPVEPFESRRILKEWYLANRTEVVEK